MREENNKQVSLSINKDLYQKYIEVKKLKDNKSKNIRGLISLVINYDINEIKLFKKMELERNIKNNFEARMRIDIDFYNNFLKICDDNNLKISQLLNNIMLKFIIECDKDFLLENLNKKNDKNNDNFIYPSEIVNYELTKEMKENIIDILNKHIIIRPRSCNNIEDLYINLYKMRYIFKYSAGEINDCFPKISTRSVQQWLKSVGWEFNTFEAQQRAVQRGRRDYKQIAITRKTTQLKNSIFGSDDEEYIRQKINIKLTSLLCNTEVIVGLNNISILNDGKEIDIPIIILKENQVYKFAIECNGDFWHKNKKRDKIKNEEVIEKGYRLFYITIAGNTKIQREIFGEVDTQIDNICQQIYKDVYREGSIPSFIM